MLCNRLLAAAIAVGFSLTALSGAVHAQALVVDGEEIADAKLFAAARAEKELSVYGTYATETITETLDEFRKDTGLKIEYIRVGSSRLYERVIAEFAAGKLDVDYIDLTDYALIKEWMSAFKANVVDLRRRIWA